MAAVLPILGRVESLLRAAVPAVTEVRVVWPNGERADGTEPDEGIDRLRRVLDDKVNPAIAAHRGRVVLVDLIDGRASIRLEGGCQGCSLAEVTVRQGIERLVRAHCPEVIAVIDTTDHSAGTEPFYTPGQALRQERASGTRTARLHRPREGLCLRRGVRPCRAAGLKNAS
jgi:Fe-S cluster biogenesis protein NfuA